MAKYRPEMKKLLLRPDEVQELPGAARDQLPDNSCLRLQSRTYEKAALSSRCSRCPSRRRFARRRQTGADVHQGRRADLLQELRRVPPADDVRADVADDVRRRAPVGALDQAARRRRARCRRGAPIRAHGTFKNDPRLTEQEIETIVAWVDAGAPKGDDKDLPAAPKFADGWTIGKPDAVFTMDEEFTIPADGTIAIPVLRGADRT